jgi:hypothetical protein
MFVLPIFLILLLKAAKKFGVLPYPAPQKRTRTRPGGTGTVLKLRCPVKEMFAGLDTRGDMTKIACKNNMLYMFFS